MSEKIEAQGNVASVSVVGNGKNNEQSNEQFVQGLEKLALAMYGRQYTGIIVAQNQSQQQIQTLRRDYQKWYTCLSPYAKIQTSDNDTKSVSRAQSFSEMEGKQKAAMIGGAATSIAGVVLGAFAGAPHIGVGVTGGAMVGGQIAGQCL